MQPMVNDVDLWLFTFWHWTHGFDVNVVKNYLKRLLDDERKSPYVQLNSTPCRTIELHTKRCEQIYFRYKTNLLFPNILILHNTGYVRCNIVWCMYCPVYCDACYKDWKLCLFCFVNFLTDFILLNRHITMDQTGTINMQTVHKFYFPFWKFIPLLNNIL